jgi:transposase
VRDHIGRDPMASVGIVDAQSVKGADTVPAASRGFDAGKKVNGRKRHVVVDTLGLLVVVLVTAASLQDRDGGQLMLARARIAMPSIVLVWADGGYAGRAVAFARQFLRITLQIVRKPAGPCVPVRYVSADGICRDGPLLLVYDAVSTAHLWKERTRWMPSCTGMRSP